LPHRLGAGAALLRVCTETFIAWTLAQTRWLRVTADGGHRRRLCGLLGPRLWPELVLPYYRRIVEALGGAGWSLHTELVRASTSRFCADGLTHINFSEDQYIQPRDVLELLPGFLDWHILTVAEMQQARGERSAPFP